MKSLLYLSLIKFKGMIRNQFRSITAGLLTIFMILLYGGLLIMVTVTSNPYQEQMKMQINNAILVGCGILALLCITLIMSKRKALVYEADAFYLFSGPFSRKQINVYILFQTLLQSAVYGFLSCYVSAMMCFDSAFSFPVILVVFFSYFLVAVFFFTLTDYIYMWSLVKKSYGRWNYIIVLGMVLITVGVFFLSMQKTGFNIKGSYMQFALSQNFHMVPFFGWAKWMAVAFISGSYADMLPGLLLLLGCDGVIIFFFLNFHQDITERAVEDAIEVSEFMKKAKSNKGNALIDTKKVKRIKGEFPEGAKAIFYKNMLQIKKTGSFLRKQDLFVILLYFAISYFLMEGNRFYIFCYMLMIWMFGLINDEDLVGDLKNYQIYLIPEPPLKKLLYAIIPAYLKVGTVISAAVLFAGILMHMPVWNILQYMFMLLGYAMIFVAGTVLSKKILKTRNNAMMENLLRMLLIFVCAVPSSVLGALSFFILRDLQMVVMVISIITFVMNFMVSGVIIVCCQSMMNGREM